MVLLGLLMKGMLSAERAVLLDLHTIRMCLLVLCGVIIPVLALRASKCDSCTHLAFLRSIIA